MKQRTLQLLMLTVLSSASAVAQINCASGSASNKLVCEFPFATGLFANDSALGGNSSSQANSPVGSAQQVATGINIAIATQVSQLPLASASAGTVIRYNSQNVPETFYNLGPILTDRAETIGKHRFFLGFSASQFVFTDIDGLSLGKLPFSYFRTAYIPGTSTVVSKTYTKEETNLSFRIDQFIGVATYGINDKVDVSVIVPIERVSLGATTFNSQSTIVNATNSQVFTYSNPNTYYPGTASGIGDVTFNGKYELWRGEHATASAALNVRTPTGDDLNLLGSGSWGFNPYVAYSYLWKISPHAKIGYQWNTDTELNSPIDPNTGKSLGKQSLPGGAQYDVGADWAALRRLTVALDLFGSQFLNTPRLSTTTTPLTTNNGTLQFPTSQTGNNSYTINNLSVGAKVSLYRNLIFSGNVLFQLNNNGLRSRPTPLIGLSYKF